MTTLQPTTHAHRAPAAAPRRLACMLAEFENPAQLLEGAEKVRDAGYRYWDCHTPFPVHGLDQAMGIRRTILPLLVFCAGAAEAVRSVWVWRVVTCGLRGRGPSWGA
ncbi:MAG: quinol:electron acceptor oxidoreductase subunit ActD, partial [Phycisphaerales bacterium]